MTETVLQHAFKTASRMIAFAVTGTLLLSVIHTITESPIAENERQAKLALFKQVIPQSSYDNNILKTTLPIAPDPLLGNHKQTLAHIASHNNKPVGVILEAIAPDGYAGDIKLLIAIRHDGTVSGVRVITHKETPGLGDYIDIARDQWIKVFDAQSLDITKAPEWKVKKDGGQFDYRVGATITPRAVVKKVHETLQYFHTHHSTLFATTKTDSIRVEDKTTLEEDK